MIDKFKEHLQSNFGFLKNKKIIIGVSGGIDSIVLSVLCKEAGLHFSIAHCNFNLRQDDSNVDQAFVEAFAKELSVDCYSVEFDTIDFAQANKVSIQIAARELRYIFFEELLDNKEYDFLFTAHHLDDSIETFFINLSRGTGLDGLLGIPEKNGRTIRPLLSFTRAQIEAFALEKGISWREDYTNAQTKYLRNKIRKHIVPLFKEVNPDFSQSFAQSISYLKQSQYLREDAVKNAYNQVVSKQGKNLCFSIEKIKILSNISAYLYEFFSPYGFTAFDDIEHLLEASSGKIVSSSTHILLKDRTELILREIEPISSIAEEFYINLNQTLTQPIKLCIKNYDENELNLGSNTILVDQDKLVFPLVIRKYRQGDTFIPLGMKGTKKVSKFFKDEKFNLFEKQNTWLLCSNNKIVWIIGSRMDERFKIENTSNNIIKIEYSV